MENKIKVKITKEDLKKASSYDSTRNCLLATALKRMGYKNVDVGGFTVDINEDIYRLDARDNSLFQKAYKFQENLESFEEFEVTLTKYYA